MFALVYDPTPYDPSDACGGCAGEVVTLARPGSYGCLDCGDTFSTLAAHPADDARTSYDPSAPIDIDIPF